jgi:YbbR domain-containing protein
MIAFLRRNLFYKIFALGAAILFYVIASYQQNPRANQLDEVYVQPGMISVPDNLVVRIPPPPFTVQVTGSPALMKAFQDQPSKAIVDASGAKAGTISLPLIYTQPGGPGQKMTINGPKTSEVTLEARHTESFPVQVIYRSEPPAGYAFDPPQVSPQTVKISGLAEEVQRVHRVTALLENSESGSGSTEQIVALKALDGKEQVIANVRLEPSRVLVTLAVRKTALRKKLLLSADIKGEVALGYRLAQYTFSPSMIEVEGDATSLESLSSLSIPVEITNMKTTQTRTITDIPVDALPTGVQVVNKTPLQCTLVLKPLNSSSEAERNNKIE